MSMLAAMVDQPWPPLFLLLSSHDLLPVPVASWGSFGIRGNAGWEYDSILFERGTQHEQIPGIAEQATRRG